MNSLSTETAQDPADRAPKLAVETKYRNENGALSQCAHCRRIRVSDDSERWDWVPAWVERPPQKVDFVLCGTCEKRHRVDVP